LSRLPLLIVCGLTVAGFGLRLAGMDQSLYGDEAYTFEIATQSGLGDVLEVVHDTSITPPLHYVLAWAAAKVGEPTFWVRVPSLLAGTATIPLLYVLGVRTVGRTAALAGTAVLALSPFALFYSDEARAYATLMLLIVVSTLALVSALASRRRGWWVLFAISSCAALYTHYTAVFPLAAQAAWALWAHRERWREILVAHAAVALGYLPWLPAYLDQRRNTLGIKTIEFLAPFTPRTVWESTSRLVPGHPFVELGEVPGRVALVLLVVGLAVALIGAARHVERPSPALVLVAAVAVATPVGALLYSAFGSSIFAARNLLASLPALCLVAGALIASAPRTYRVIALPLVLAALLVGSVKALGPDYRRPPWKQAADLIDAQAGPRDPVVEIQAFVTRRPVGRREVQSRLRLDLDRPHPVYPVAQRDRRIWDRLAGARRVYVVIGQLTGLEGTPPPPRVDSRFRLLGRRAYRGFDPVAVYVYASGTEAARRPSTTRST
jgi:4-amino-4-deoxy-L-arabinose transferase-like glycosyltransferase